MRRMSRRRTDDYRSVRHLQGQRQGTPLTHARSGDTRPESKTAFRFGCEVKEKPDTTAALPVTFMCSFA